MKISEFDYVFVIMGGWILPKHLFAIKMSGEYVESVDFDTALLAKEEDFEIPNPVEKKLTEKLTEKDFQPSYESDAAMRTVRMYKVEDGKLKMLYKTSYDTKNIKVVSLVQDNITRVTE